MTEQQQRLAKFKSAAAAPGSTDNGAILAADLELPEWVSPKDLGASMEALGGLYASKGKAE